MKQEQIKAIIKDKVDDITALCSNINSSFDEETIHNFRVEVKSLRSFLRLQHMHTHKPGMKMPKKFMRLYHIAGGIRETQLEITRFERKKPNLPHYLVELYRSLDEYKQEWRKHYSEKVLNRLGEKLAGFRYKTIHPDILKKFFDKKIEVIDTITNQPAPTDTQVHTVRKQIKDILYNAKVANKNWSAAHKEIRSVPVKKLDSLANIIGGYNDERIMLGHLSAYSSAGLGKEEKNDLKNLENKEVRRLYVKKKKILATAKNIHSKENSKG